MLCLRVRLMITMFLLLIPVSTFAARIIYVDNDAIGIKDGSDWENAYVYLQDALAEADTADKPVEIRLAQGVYKPDQGVNQTLGDRDATFQLINGVSLKGGYAGFGQSDPNTRDIETYETILSGDIDSDDVYVSDPCDLFEEPTRRGNSRNVVTSRNTDATAVLDGVTITGGYIWVITLNGPGGEPAGGAGVLISSGSPRLIDCTFTGNATGNAGGGLLLYDNSNPMLINCKFTRNYAREGGGIWSSNSNPILFDCIFENNYALRKGGGISNRVSNPELTNCLFSHNLTSGRGSIPDGGGMYNRDSSPILKNCTFSNNAASRGGAVYNDINTSSTLTGCMFSDNLADRAGGAIYNDNSGSSSVLTNCTFKKNYASSGGAMSVICPTFLTDCIFTGNSAAWDGGAIYAVSTTFENCIFSGNRVLEFGNDILGGGAVHIPGTAMLDKKVTINNCTFIKNWSEFGCAISYFGLASMNNCILWGSENQIYEHSPYGAPSFVRYSNVQGGCEGEGNIDIDPLFVEPGYWAHAEDPNVVVEPNEPNADWVDGDYHLKSQAGRWDLNSQSWIQDDVTSPCIDSGDPNSPIQLEPFPNGGIINMGAYGGTAEASKSYFDQPVCETIVAGDINGDCRVDIKDFALMIAHWLEDHTPLQ